MSEWSHLPNAPHIDRILAFLKSHPEAWNAARSADRSAAWSAAWNAARSADRSAAWNAASDAAWSAASDAARSAAWSAACGAIMALIAWDNSAKYLDMSSDQLKVWMHLSDDPATVLLLPAVIAFEKINEMEIVNA